MERPAGARVVREFTLRVHGAPRRVFALLCPTREHDWVDGWRAELVHSASGYAEPDCVFVIDLAERGREIAVVTRHDPERNEVEFVFVCPETHLEHLSIAVRDGGDGTSILHWRRAYTGLSPAGDDFVREYAGETLTGRMQFLERALDHYLRTAEMLRR